MYNTYPRLVKLPYNNFPLRTFLKLNIFFELHFHKEQPFLQGLIHKKLFLFWPI